MLKRKRPVVYKEASPSYPLFRTSVCFRQVSSPLHPPEPLSSPTVSASRAIRNFHSFTNPQPTCSSPLASSPLPLSAVCPTPFSPCQSSPLTISLLQSSQSPRSPPLLYQPLVSLRRSSSLRLAGARLAPSGGRLSVCKRSRFLSVISHGSSGTP